MILTEQQLRGVVHGAEAVLPHLVDAQFGGAAKAVLDAAQDAVEVVLVALELQHRIDDVLQHLGSCQAALFVDVANQDNRCMALLGVAQDGCGTLSDLRHAAGRRLGHLGR